MNENGKFLCENCGREFDSAGAVSGHQRFCDGGKWRCNWCKCDSSQCSGKTPGPDGPATLCAACGSRYRSGATGPPVQNEDGHYVCECGRTLATIVALASHKRRCDGGNWRCDWCCCTIEQCSGKNPGPNGPATLCGACGSRYRSGAMGPPPTDENGWFICEDCGAFIT